MITTTLNRIREHSPCKDGWEKLLAGLGKTKADDEALPFAKILEINGLDDAVWCCRAEPQYEREWRLFMVACARRIQHLTPDPVIKNAIDVAEQYANGEATKRELAKARLAVHDLAAHFSKQRIFMGGGLLNAAWYAARAAESATGSILAVYDASLVTARAAVMNDEVKWQTQEFLRVATETEARSA